MPGSEELTIDHIIPKALGGKTTWENCVLACVECNSVKGSFFMEQVKNKKFPHGMKLLKKPFRPKLKDFKMAMIYESWKNWLSESYWNVELENDNRL
jgi:5-methylcytosine-specific restriction endonuclease McrA